MCLAQTLTSGTQVNFTGPNEGPIEGTVFIEEFLPVQRDAEGTRIDCRSIQVFYGDGWAMQHEKLPSSAWRAASPDRFTCTDLHRWPFFSPFFLHSIRRLISHFFQNWIPFKNGSLHILARNGFFWGKMWHFGQESGAPSCFDPLGTVVKETDALMTARISKEKWRNCQVH